MPLASFRALVSVPVSVCLRALRTQRLLPLSLAFGAMLGLGAPRAGAQTAVGRRSVSPLRRNHAVPYCSMESECVYT